MKPIHKYLLIILLQLSASYYAFAGCSFVPMFPIVVGNYTYDSISSTCYCHDGDTLLFIYNGTGGGDSYVEYYYFNNTLIKSNLLIGYNPDTIKVFRAGIYSVEHGCSAGMTFTHSKTFVFSSVSATSEISIDDRQVNVYFDGATNSINVFLHSETLKYFDVEVFSVTGQKVSESNNLTSDNNYSLPLISNGLNIIRITDRQGKSFIRKVIAL